MKFQKGNNRNPFNSRQTRGRGPHRGSQSRRGKFNVQNPRNFGKEWVPPAQNIIPFGKLSYCCQGDVVCKAGVENVPFFNAPMYLSNRQQIGKIDEIFGNPRDYMVTIKLDENIKATSFSPCETFYIDTSKLLPLARFLPKSRGAKTRPGTGGQAKFAYKFGGKTKKTKSFYRK